MSLPYIKGPRLTPTMKHVCIHQVEIDSALLKWLEDALTRLAAGMGVDEGEEPEWDDKAEQKKKRKGEGGAGLLAKKLLIGHTIPVTSGYHFCVLYMIFFFYFGPFLWSSDKEEMSNRKSNWYGLCIYTTQSLLPTVPIDTTLLGQAGVAYVYILHNHYCWLFP